MVKKNFASNDVAELIANQNCVETFFWRPRRLSCPPCASFCFMHFFFGRFAPQKKMKKKRVWAVGETPFTIAKSRQDQRKAVRDSRKPSENRVKAVRKGPKAVRKGPKAVRKLPKAVRKGPKAIRKRPKALD